MNDIISNYDYLQGGSETNLIEEEVLLDPSDECDELHILSGYANSAMLKRHLDMLEEHLGEGSKKIQIHLIIGMIPKEGISTIEHLAFKELVSSYRNVNCSYLMCNCRPCHSKVYVWLNEGKPAKAFVGSANYSQNAFYNQIESLAICNPFDAEDYFQQFIGHTVFCNHDEVEDAVKIVSKKSFMQKMRAVEENPLSNIPAVRLSLLEKQTHDVHNVSGLNWGQRPGREPNQACIPIPREIGKTGFFPPKKQVFTLMTDDGFVMQCVVQGNKETDPVPKQLTTTNNNSEIGRYFRRRLGLEEGSFVTKQDLERYGRDDVVIFKLDDGTYYMDFKKPDAHSLSIED